MLPKTGIRMITDVYHVTHIYMQIFFVSGRKGKSSGSGVSGRSNDSLRGSHDTFLPRPPHPVPRPRMPPPHEQIWVHVTNLRIYTYILCVYFLIPCVLAAMYKFTNALFILVRQVSATTKAGGTNRQTRRTSTYTFTAYIGQ